MCAVWCGAREHGGDRFILHTRGLRPIAFVPTSPLSPKVEVPCPKGNVFCTWLTPLGSSPRGGGTEDTVVTTLQHFVTTGIDIHCFPVHAHSLELLPPVLPPVLDVIGTQVTLATRYVAVLLYDDTAVKNEYRLPLGLGVVIDGEYYSRIVFQSLTADTKTGTFVWILEEFKAARGAVPDMFLQDADAAMTQAADRVFPDAKKRRCMWHLGKNLLTNLRGLLGGHFNVSRNVYLIVVCVLQRTLDRPLKKCSALLRFRLK